MKDIDKIQDADVKMHINRMIASMLARFTVISTVYFIAICILFSVALVRLNITDNQLQEILSNQILIEKDESKLFGVLNSHTDNIKTIIHVLNRVKK